MNLKHLWSLLLLCAAVTLNAQTPVSVKGVFQNGKFRAVLTGRQRTVLCPD